MPQQNVDTVDRYWLIVDRMHYYRGRQKSASQVAKML